VIRAAALGLTLVVTILLTSCGLLVTDEVPIGAVQASAPALVPTFPEVDALVPPATRSLSAAGAIRLARRAALQVRIPACDDDALGRGFALDAHTLVAHRDAVPGGGWVRVQTGNGRSTAVGSANAYRLGDLGVVRVARPLPRAARGTTVDAGAWVVAVVERNGKLRALPGVVVDSVPGARFDARTNVLRITSEVRDDDAGVLLDARGRIVGAVFGIDPKTTFGVALPAAALRGRPAAAGLEALDACDA
jgi:hypothetical protein